MRALAAARAVVLGFALVACSGPATTSSTPTQSPSTSAGDSHSTSPSTAASVTCDDTALCDGEVSPGTYAFTVSGRSVQLELGDGWTADVGDADVGVQLVREGAAIQGLSFNEFTGRVYGSPCAGIGASESIEVNPESFVAYLSDRDGLSVAGAPSATTIGGQAALQVDVTVGLPSTCPEEVGDNFIFGIGDEGEFHLQPGETARIWVVGGAGDPIIVVLESFSDEGFAEIVPIAEEVLASTTIS